jgi:cation diffusion facilitator family transporter
MISVMAAIGLVTAKLIAGFLTNSLAVYSEAGHSAVDLLAACISYIAIRRAALPPDKDHPFGHAKYESIGALIELSFLVVLGIGIVYSAIQRLLHGGGEIVITPVSAILIALTLSVDLWRTLSLHRAAKATHSEALAASAMHFLSDLLGTVLVVFGLIFTALGFPKADTIAAILIAGLVLVLSFRLGRQVFSSLTDRVPAGLTGEVEQLVLTVNNVRGVHDIRMRQAGSQTFAEMHVHLDPTLSLEQAHEVLDNIETTLHTRFPQMQVVTHPEPTEAAPQSGWAH